MKAIALGTGTSQGVPVIGCTCAVCQSTDKRDKRLRSSIYIEINNLKLLIDIGPDFRSQFLENQLTTIDAILITHEHNDHIIGLDDVRAINFTQKKSIPLYAEAHVNMSIRQRFEYAFQKSKIPGLPQINLNDITEEKFKIQDLLIQPLRVMHGKLPILGFKIGDLAYITDASQIDNDTINKIKDIKVLIINALRQEKHYSHFTLSEALSHIEKINPQRAYITHISHNMGLNRDWEQLLPDNVNALLDNMVIKMT